MEDSLPNEEISNSSLHIPEIFSHSFSKDQLLAKYQVIFFIYPYISLHLTIGFPEKAARFSKLKKIWILSANNKRYMDKKYRSLRNYRVLEIYCKIRLFEHVFMVFSV